MQISCCGNGYTVYLSEEELLQRGLSFEDIDYGCERTRLLFDEIFAKCRERFGACGDSRKTLIKVYRRGGGLKAVIRQGGDGYIFKFSSLSLLYDLAERCGEQSGDCHGLSLLADGDCFFLTVYPFTDAESRIVSFAGEYGQRTEFSEAENAEVLMRGQVLRRLCGF